MAGASPTRVGQRRRRRLLLLLLLVATPAVHGIVQELGPEAFFDATHADPRSAYVVKLMHTVHGDLLSSEKRHDGAVMFLLEEPRKGVVFGRCSARADPSRAWIHGRVVSKDEPQQDVWAVRVHNLTHRAVRVLCAFPEASLSTLECVRDVCQAKLELFAPGAAPAAAVLPALDVRHRPSAPQPLLDIRYSSAGPFANPRAPTLPRYEEGSVGVCTATLWNKPTLIKPWLEHMSTMDVVIYAYVDGALDGSVAGEFNRAVEDGTVISIDWRQRLSSKRREHEVFFHEQHMAYQDCHLRAVLRHSWIIFLDTDDFPFFVSGRTIPGELEALTAHRPAVGEVRWVWNRHKGGRCPYYAPTDLHHNLRVCNASLAPYRYTKHAVRPDALLEGGVHFSRKLRRGFDVTDVPPTAGYVSHLEAMSKETIDRLEDSQHWWDPQRAGLLYK